MIQTIDVKTSSFIQNLNVNGGRPKSATATPVVVRPPSNLKCFRATITVNNNDAGNNTQLYISNTPVTSEDYCLILATFQAVNTAVAPATDIQFTTTQTWVFDRRSVGYMVDEFYFYSDDAIVTIVWEGVLNQE